MPKQLVQQAGSAPDKLSTCLISIMFSCCTGATVNAENPIGSLYRYTTPKQKICKWQYPIGLSNRGVKYKVVITVIIIIVMIIIITFAAAALPLYCWNVWDKYHFPAWPYLLWNSDISYALWVIWDTFLCAIDLILWVLHFLHWEILIHNLNWSYSLRRVFLFLCNYPRIFQ